MRASAPPEAGQDMNSRAMRKPIFKKLQTSSTPGINLDPAPTGDPIGKPSRASTPSPRVDGQLLFRSSRPPPIPVQDARASDISMGTSLLIVPEARGQDDVITQSKYPIDDRIEEDLDYDTIFPALDVAPQMVGDSELDSDIPLDMNAMTCGICGEPLKSADDIDLHIRMHGPVADVHDPLAPYHGTSPSPSPPLDPTFPFQCPICGARFRSEVRLKFHVSRLGHYVPLEGRIHDLIGIPSGTPPKELLNLISSTFAGISRSLPPAEAVAKLLTVCRREGGSGPLPPYQVLLGKGQLGRAWQSILAQASPASSVPEPEGEERAKVIRDLHPLPLPVDLPDVPHFQGTPPKITAKALVKEIQSMRNVATGPSGLGKAHLLHLCEDESFRETLANLLSSLYASRDWSVLKPLAGFRLRLIAKPNGKWRPIAIQETLLVVFHKLILKQTQPLRTLPGWQLAFDKLAQMKAIRKAEELKRSYHLTTIDVKNAFNSVPHSVISFSLHRARVPVSTVAYIESFLAARHSLDLPSVPCGVPQGDPLSMAIFCQSIVWPIETHLSQYKVIAYADDLVLVSEEGVHVDKVKEDARVALARIGLTVEPSKCTSTQMGSISFMGTKIVKDSPYSLAETSARKLQDYLKILRETDISLHNQLRLLALCIVPSVNYGPLVDEYPGPSPYAEVDSQIVKMISSLLGTSEALSLALALTPRGKYGLGMILPHHYYPEMQLQRKALKAGIFRELRKKRLTEVDHLRSFLPLALLGPMPLDNKQLRFIGDCLAGHYQNTSYMGTCRFCSQPMVYPHHLVCRAVNGYHVTRHEKMINALIAASKSQAGHIVKNPAIPIDGLQPDLIMGNAYADMAVVVPWRLDKAYAIKENKYKPLVLSGRASSFIPIIVGSDGTIHPLSALELSKAGVDMMRFKMEAAQVILWHFDRTAAAYALLANGASRQPVPAACPRAMAPPSAAASKMTDQAIQSSGPEPTPSRKALVPSLSESGKKARADLMSLAASPPLTNKPPSEVPTSVMHGDQGARLRGEPKDGQLKGAGAMNTELSGPMPIGDKEAIPAEASVLTPRRVCLSMPPPRRGGSPKEAPAVNEFHVLTPGLPRSKAQRPTFSHPGEVAEMQPHLKALPSFFRRMDRQASLAVDEVPILIARAIAPSAPRGPDKFLCCQGVVSFNKG